MTRRIDSVDVTGATRPNVDVTRGARADVVVARGARLEVDITDVVGGRAEVLDVEHDLEAFEVDITKAGGGLGPPGPQGPTGPQGPPGLGALAGIQGTLESPALLPDPGAFVGEAYIIGNDLWVWGVVTP
jgi:hypothetical protein